MWGEHYHAQMLLGILKMQILSYKFKNMKYQWRQTEATENEAAASRSAYEAKIQNNNLPHQLWRHNL